MFRDLRQGFVSLFILILCSCIALSFTGWLRTEQVFTRIVIGSIAKQSAQHLNSSIIQTLSSTPTHSIFIYLEPLEKAVENSEVYDLFEAMLQTNANTPYGVILNNRKTSTETSFEAGILKLSDTNYASIAIIYDVLGDANLGKRLTDPLARDIAYFEHSKP